MFFDAASEGQVSSWNSEAFGFGIGSRPSLQHEEGSFKSAHSLRSPASNRMDKKGS